MYIYLLISGDVVPCFRQISLKTYVIAVVDWYASYAVACWSRLLWFAVRCSCNWWKSLEVASLQFLLKDFPLPTVETFARTLFRSGHSIDDLCLFRNYVHAVNTSCFVIEKGMLTGALDKQQSVIDRLMTRQRVLQLSDNGGQIMLRIEPTTS